MTPQTAAPSRRPSSPRRIASSRANGKLSRGPTTPEGKRKSCANSIKHGLAATKTVVLPSESTADFAALRNAFVAEHRPTTTHERLLIEVMTISLWLQRRVWSIQKDDLDREMSRHDPAIPAPMRAAIAFRELGSNGTSLALALRYETKYERQFSRALRNLLTLKSQRVEIIERNENHNVFEPEKQEMQVNPSPNSERPRRTNRCRTRQPRCKPRKSRTANHHAATPCYAVKDPW